MKIIIDTREKVGAWTFGEKTISKKLDSGDYSLIGYENILCIERKKTVSEIALNIGSGRARFNRELERMKKIPHSYLICEFSLEDILGFPQNSGLKQSTIDNIRIGGKYIQKVLSSYEELYGVQVIYAGDRANAIEIAMEIFKDVQRS